MTPGAFGGEQWKRRMEVWASAGDRAAMTGPPPGGRQQGKVKACSRWGPHPCAGGEGLHTVLLGAPCPPLLGLLPRSCDSDSAMQAPAKTWFFFFGRGGILAHPLLKHFSPKQDCVCVRGSAAPSPCQRGESGLVEGGQALVQAV